MIHDECHKAFEASPQFQVFKDRQYKSDIVDGHYCNPFIENAWVRWCEAWSAAVLYMLKWDKPSETE